MTIWKPIAAAAGCTALLGMVAGMKVPTEMVIPDKPEWRNSVEQTFVAGSDDRLLYEAGPEDLYVPRSDPMTHRVAYDAMADMNERAAEPRTIDSSATSPQSGSAFYSREIMPVALTQNDVMPARSRVTPQEGRSTAIVRVVSGTGHETDRVEPVAAPVKRPVDALSLTEVATIPQT